MFEDIRSAINRSEELWAKQIWPGTREWSERQRIDKHLDKMQRDAAVAFGAFFGGTLCRPFSMENLAADRPCEDALWLTYDSTTIDHPEYYRCGRRAAVIVAHVYKAKERDIREFAEESRVRVWLPDFPSWYYPGWARLIAYLGPVGLEGLRQHNPDIAAAVES
jgi:hypothetical protein